MDYMRKAKRKLFRRSGSTSKDSVVDFKINNANVNILYWEERLMGDNSPALIHIAIFVFGKIYEYSPSGSQFERRKRYGYALQRLPPTTFFQDDFEKWIHENSRQFSKTKWNLESHNSIHFASQACKFLAIEAPVLKKLQEQMQANASFGISTFSSEEIYNAYSKLLLGSLSRN